MVLNKKATEYVRLNASVKGTPNMTAINFCKWVNKSLLPNSTLEPGYPLKISVVTAWRWLHELGFQVITTRMGIFIDGHERKDVIEQRNNFLRRMVKLVFFIYKSSYQSSQKAFPTDKDPHYTVKNGVSIYNGCRCIYKKRV